MVRAGGDFSGLIKAANKASSATGKMQKSMESHFAGIKKVASGLNKVLGAIGVTVSVAAIVSAAKDAKEAYDAQAVSEAKLQQVMRNTMQASNAEVKSILDLASAQQKLGVIGTEVQIAGAQELATYLFKTSSLQRLIPVMNDMLAQQHGLNASQEQAANMATMLGRVLSGQVGALGRYGYFYNAAQEKILKFGTEEQRVAVLAEVVEQSVGGMNAALAQTPSGRLKQVENTMGDIKEEFGRAVTTILTVFLPVLQRVAEGLATVAAFANRVAATIAKVFGGQVSTAQDYAGATGQATESIDELGEGLEGTTKKAEKLKRAMADFDNLHVLSFGKDSGTDAETGGGSGGASTIAFTGLEIAEQQEETVGWLEEKLKKLKQWLDSDDAKKFSDSFSHLTESLGNLAKTLAEKLGPLLENLAKFLLPVIADILETIASALDSINELLNGTKTLQELDKEFFDWMYAEDAGPLARLFRFFDQLNGGPIFRGFGKKIKEWLGIGEIDWSEEWNRFIEGFGDIRNPFEFWGEAFQTEVIKPIGDAWDKFREKLGLDADGSWARIKQAFEDPAGWWEENVTGPIGEKWSALKVKLGLDADGSWARIRQAFEDPAGWWEDNVTSPIRDKWTKLQAFFDEDHDWFGPLEKAITDFRNFVRSTAEGIANGFIDGINAIKRALNSIQISVPVDVPLIGGTNFGFNLPDTPHVSIPRLATGAVINPNREFAAVLGDQTSGMNIETPERLLRQIMREEQGGNTGRIIDLLMMIIRLLRAGQRLEVNDMVFAQVVKQAINDMLLRGEFLPI